MDQRLLGLALANAPAGYGAALQGEKDAMAMETARRQQQDQMMELALKDAFYERKQKAMNIELLSKIPALNQAMIDEETRAALSPYGRIQSINPVMDLRLQAPQIPEAYAPGYDVSGLGPAARKVVDGYKTGQSQFEGSPSPKPMTAQEKSIEKLRNMPETPSRSPQSEGSIVQPLEGPLIDRALNEVATPKSPFSAMKNPEFQQKMFDAMARTGYQDPLLDPRFVGDAMNSMAFTGQVPGMAVQTEKTFDALKGVRDASYLAAKSSAGMNQQAQEVQAKIELQRLEMQKNNAEFNLKLAQQAGDQNAERIAKAQSEYFRGLIDLIQSQTQRPARGGSSKEDPNAADFRKQLNQLQSDVRNSVEEQIKSLGGFVTPERRARIQKDILKSDPTIAGLAEALRSKAGQYPQIAANYSGLFSQLGMPLGGSSQAPAAGKTPGANKAMDILNSRRAPKPSVTPKP